MGKNRNKKKTRIRDEQNACYVIFVVRFRWTFDWQGWVNGRQGILVKVRFFFCFFSLRSGLTDSQGISEGIADTKIWLFDEKV